MNKYVALGLLSKLFISEISTNGYYIYLIKHKPLENMSHMQISVEIFLYKGTETTIPKLKCRLAEYDLIIVQC